MTDIRTPETFRGIPVPEVYKNRPHLLAYGMWKHAVVDVLAVVVPLLEEFETDAQCSLDHTGFCSEHWSGGDGDPCRNSVLASFLDLARHDESVWMRTTEGDPLVWCYQHRPQGFNLGPSNIVPITTLVEQGVTARCVQCGREVPGR